MEDLEENSVKLESSMKVDGDKKKAAAAAAGSRPKPPAHSVSVESTGSGDSSLRRGEAVVEVALLCVFILVIWVVLALPVLFFYLPVEDIEVSIPTCTNSSCNDMATADAPFPPSSGSGMATNFSSSSPSSGSGMSTDTPGNTMGNGMLNNNNINNNTTPLTCNRDAGFFYNPVTGDCGPECPAWGQHENYISKLIDKIVLVCACIGVISAVSVLIISCVRHKHIFSFPSVFIVYLTATLLLLVSFVVINFMDRGRLFCSSMDLRLSIVEPTPFCIIAGVVFYYALIQITLWWLFHIAALFLIFRFPLHFRRWQKLHRIRFIHIFCVVMGLLLPALPVVVTMADYATDVRGPRDPKGLGFGLTNFPPILCAGLDPNATFYSLILPITILTEVGMTLLLFTFWDVRKNHSYSFRKALKQRKKKGLQCLKIGSGEKKIVIVLLYYVLLVEFSLMAFSLATRNLGQFRTAVAINFQCESSGLTPLVADGDEATPTCDASRSQLEALKFPWVNLVAYMLLVLFPVINFTYVIKFRVLKKWCCAYVLRRKGVAAGGGGAALTASGAYSRQNSLAESNSYSVNLKRVKFSNGHSVSLVVPESQIIHEQV